MHRNKPQQLLDRFIYAITLAFVVLLIFCFGVFIKRVGGAEPELTQQAAVVHLGRTAYWDTRVSQYNTTSCGSCHDPVRYGSSDGLPLAVGMKGARDQLGRLVPNGLIGPRRTPPIVNVTQLQYLTTKKMFLDHRATDPIDQVTQPMENPIEMGNQTKQQVVNRLNRYVGYRQLCAKAFPNADRNGDGEALLTVRMLAESIVAFEGTMAAIETPLNDYYQEKVDLATLSPEFKRGAELFRVYCIECHKPPLFTNGECYNTGLESRFQRFLRSRDPNHKLDNGLAKETKKVEDLRKFKTPGLVGVSMRKYLGHNGQVRSVKEMLKHYQMGGRFQYSGEDSRLDPHIDERVKNFISPETGKPILTQQDLDDLYVVVVDGTTPNDWPNPEDVGPPKVFP